MAGRRKKQYERIHEINRRVATLDPETWTN